MRGSATTCIIHRKRRCTMALNSSSATGSRELCLLPIPAPGNQLPACLPACLNACIGKPLQSPHAWTLSLCSPSPLHPPLVIPVTKPRPHTRLSLVIPTLSPSPLPPPAVFLCRVLRVWTRQGCGLVSEPVRVHVVLSVSLPVLHCTALHCCLAGCACRLAALVSTSRLMTATTRMEVIWHGSARTYNTS